MPFKITIETIVTHIGRNIIVHIIKILFSQIVKLKKTMQKITKIIPLCKGRSHIERGQGFTKLSTVFTSKFSFAAFHLKFVAIEADQNGTCIAFIHRKKHLPVEFHKFIF